MPVWSSRNFRSLGAVFLACALILGVGWSAAWAAAAPTKKVTSTNDFVGDPLDPPTPPKTYVSSTFGGHGLNGEVILDASPQVGLDESGFIGRAQKTLASVALGNFAAIPPALPVEEGRQGAAAVIARGPVDPAALPESRRANKYIYAFGGLTGGLAPVPNSPLSQIVRAEIASDGRLYPNITPLAAQLQNARYGATAVAWGNYIYVIGGYGAGGVVLNDIERFTILPDGTLDSDPANRWVLPGALTFPGLVNSQGQPIDGLGDVGAVVLNGWLYVIGGSTTLRDWNQTNTPYCFRAELRADGELMGTTDIGLPTRTGSAAFLRLPDLMVAAGGGRVVAVHVAGDDPGTTARYHLYYIGGSISQGQGSQSGASTFVEYLAIDSTTNAVIGDTWIAPATGVQLLDGRELFGAVAIDGYMYVIGGVSKFSDQTNIYASVERAEILAGGQLGPFIKMQGTGIEPQPGLSDMVALADNHKIFVPYGVNLVSGVQGSIFALDLLPGLGLDPAAVPGVPDDSLFSSMLDLGIVGDGIMPGDLYNIRMMIDYGSGTGAWFRFRTATGPDQPFIGKGRGTDATTPWSNWIQIKNLPFDPDDPGSGTVGRIHLLDLRYEPGVTTPCLEGVIPNPSGVRFAEVSGENAVRFLDYQVVLPADGDFANKFDELVINRRLLDYATPGGYSPANPGTLGDAPPNALACRPNHAIADAPIGDLDGPVPWAVGRIVRLNGVGLPTGPIDFADVHIEAWSLPPGAVAPQINLLEAAGYDGDKIDLHISITLDPMLTYDQYPYVYRITLGPSALPSTTFPYPLTLDPGLQVFPAITVDGPEINGLGSLIVGLDTDLTTPGRDNVVLAPMPGIEFVTYVTGIFGTNFRSGRINVNPETGEAFVDDASPFGWPQGPMSMGAPDSPIPQFLQYQVYDATQVVGGIYTAIEPQYLSGAIGVVPFGWVEPKPENGLLPGYQNPGQLNLTLAVPYTATSGAHDLFIGVVDPQVGSAYAVRQTVYVVPRFNVYDVNTTVDTLSPCMVTTDPGIHFWAHAKRGDGIDPEELTINVVGQGFQSSSGTDLVQTDTVAYDPTGGPVREDPLVTPPYGAVVVDDQHFDIDTQVPLTSPTGPYLVTFDWEYRLCGNGEPPSDPPGILPPSTCDPVMYSWPDNWYPMGDPPNADRTEFAMADELGLYIDPPPPAITSIVGSFQEFPTNPIVLMQGDPRLIINGNGFAVDLPVYPTSAVTSVILKSIVDPSEDTPATRWTINSDRQLTAWFDVPLIRRPGQLYYIEINTEATNDLDPADPCAVGPAVFPDPNGNPSDLIIVVAAPTCGSLLRIESNCAYGVQGDERIPMEITGTNFEPALPDGLTVDFGPGITVSDLRVWQGDTEIVAGSPLLGDRLTFNVSIDGDAEPGARSVKVSNGIAYNHDQSCTFVDLFVVAPNLSLSQIVPSQTHQPSSAEGQKTVEVEIFGHGFAPDAQVTMSQPDAQFAFGPPSVVVTEITPDKIAAKITIDRSTPTGTWLVTVSEASGTDCVQSPLSASLFFTIVANPEIPTIVYVNPTIMGRGTSHTLTIVGTNFLPGSTVAVEPAADITLGTPTVVDSNQITVPITIGANAAVGFRAVVVTTNDNGTVRTARLTDAFTISICETPVSVSNVQPKLLTVGGTKQFVITGYNFKPGATVTVTPADGLTVTPVSITDTAIFVTIAASGSATVGVKSLTVTNPEGGTCGTAVVPSAFWVSICELPVRVDAIAPAALAQGTSRNYIITGENFRPDSSVTVTPADGITVSVVSRTDSTIIVTLSASAATPAGVKTVCVVNPPGTGICDKGCTTLTVAEAPTLLRIDPSTRGIGQVNQNLTLTGHAFQPGALVEIDCPGGYEGGGDSEDCCVTFVGGGSNVNVNPGGGYLSPEHIVVTVDIGSNCLPGPIWFRVTNPDLGTTGWAELFHVTAPGIPTPPTDLEVSVGGGKAKLTWQDNSDNETNFIVEWSIDEGGWKVVQNTTPPVIIGSSAPQGTTGAILKVKPGTLYAFRVKAVVMNAAKKLLAASDPSNVVSVSVDAKLKGADKATGLSVSAGSGGVTLNWSPTGAGRGIQILRAYGNQAFVPLPFVLPPTYSSYVDHDLASGGKYRYKVRVVNNFNFVDSAAKKVVF